jgi:hypothetical protein
MYLHGKSFESTDDSRITHGQHLLLPVLGIGAYLGKNCI